MNTNEHEADELIARFGPGKEQAIPVLQEIQRRHGYLPENLLKTICRKADFTETDLFGIATFYSQFRFKKRGRNALKVCVGTACHVAGAPQVVEAIQTELNINKGETSQDDEFSLETVACLGCCSLAPVMMQNEDTIGNLDPLKIGSVLKKGRI
jgi:NADH:ubiquinone oxidoreductase subunit E